MSDKLLILTCQNHEPELRAALKLEKFEDVEILSMPARCGRPPLSMSEIQTYCQSHLENTHIHLLGFSCVHEMHKDRQDQKIITVQCLENCFQLFADQSMLNHFITKGYYLVTSGWVECWRINMNIMGFDQQTAREFFADTTKKILLLETMVEEERGDLFLEFTRFIDRPAEILPIGLSYVRLFLSQIINKWRLQNEAEKADKIVSDCRNQLSEYAMAMDILKDLSPTSSELEIVHKIREICTMLFAPQVLHYLQYQNNSPAAVLPDLAAGGEKPESSGEMLPDTEGYQLLESGSGFRLRLESQNETLGVLEVDDIAFPQYRDRYLNLALNMVPIWSLAIVNARKVQMIKETEQARRKSEEKLSLIFRSSPHAITVSDLKGTIIECNPMTAQMLGFSSKEDLIGRNVLTFFPEQEHETAQKNTALTLSQGYVNNVAYSHIRQDGSIFPVVLSASVMRDHDGDPEGFVAITIDNTERLIAENERKKLLNALEQTADSVFITSRTGIIEYVNRSFEVTTGYSASEVVGQSPKLLQSGQHEKEYYKEMWKTILAGHVFRREIINRKKNGALIHEEQTISPVKDKQGNISHFISAARDITEKKRIELLREDIERIVRHDLKTPLTGIMGYSQLLYRERLTDEQREWLDIIYNRGKQMLQMIDQSLDLYKMEMGIYKLERDQINLIRLFQEIDEELKHIIKAKSLKLQFLIEQQVFSWKRQYMLGGEQLYLKQMLSNLIKNALEASPQAGVVTVAIQDNLPFHSITIHNQGIIPENICLIFFDKYSTTGKKDGTGLGTYSASLIAKAHGGAITFTTSKQEGTTLSIRLPKNL